MFPFEGITNLDRSIDEHPIHKLASPVNHLWQMASFLFNKTGNKNEQPFLQ